jgi:hypothetical protein
MPASSWKQFEELAASIQAELAPEAKVTANAKLRVQAGPGLSNDCARSQSSTKVVKL